MQQRRALKLASCVALLIAVPIASPQAVQNTDTNAGTSSAAALARLTKELNDLTIEVLQLRMAAEQARLETLEREARQSEADLRELADEENGLKQEVEELQRQSLDGTLTAEQQAEIAATVSKALAEGSARLNDQRVALERKGVTLRTKLAQARETRSRLLARAAALGLGPGQVLR
jgi:phosphoserine aminotransferase